MGSFHLRRPTTGLHFDDIALLVRLFNAGRGGNSIVVIEHNLEVMSAPTDQSTSARRGEDGGTVDCERHAGRGTKAENSHTGEFCRAAREHRPLACRSRWLAANRER